MNGLATTYVKEIHKNLRYRPTWLPGTPVELGSVGVLEEGVFRPLTDLARLGLEFETLTDRVADGSMDYASTSGASITVKAAGETDQRFKAIASAQAGALVEFSREGATVIQLRNVTIDRIADQPRLHRDMLRSIAVPDDAARWERDWVVITDVVRADSATILIAASAGSRIELEAEAKIAPSSLADVSAGLTVASESNVSTKIIARSGLTPLYRGSRVRRNFWWLYDEVLVASAEAPNPDEVFADADPVDDPEWAR